MWKRVRGREGRREGDGWMEWKTVTESVADTERERVDDGAGFEGEIKSEIEQLCKRIRKQEGAKVWGAPVRGSREWGHYIGVGRKQARHS